jgi:hypothetical protein
MYRPRVCRRSSRRLMICREMTGLIKKTIRSLDVTKIIIYL